MHLISSKLPAYYKNSPLFQQLMKPISKARVMFSFLLYERDGKDFCLKKDGTMHAPQDWQAFSIMRAAAGLLLVTGKVIRAEKGLYLTRESYGDKYVDQLYQNLVGSKTQKLMVLSRTMTRAQLTKEVNPNFYELVDMPDFTSVGDLIHKISAKSDEPLLVENGLQSMHSYFQQVLKGCPNSIDTIMISKFSGPLPEKYIGEQSNLPIQALYKKTWKSEPYPCILPGNIEGKLSFSTFSL